MVAREVQAGYFSFFLKMEAAISFETFASFYHITSRHISSLKTSKRIMTIFFHAVIS
jgi:hypothetical protein